MPDIPQLMQRYSMTEEWLLAKFLAGVCEICAVEATLVVDHDHGCCDSVKACGDCVRGVLCISCNNRLGKVERGYGTSNLDWIVLAEVYVGHHLNPIAVHQMRRRGPGIKGPKPVKTGRVRKVRKPRVPKPPKVRVVRVKAEPKVRGPWIIGADDRGRVTVVPLVDLAADYFVHVEGDSIYLRKTERFTLTRGD